MLDDVNAQQCFAFTTFQTFLPIIWIFTESEGDGMESRLPFKILSTLNNLLIPIILTQKFAFLHMMNYYFCSPPKLLTKWQVPSATFLWYVFKSIYHVLSTYLSFRKYYWICVLLATTLRQYHELIWKRKRIEKVLSTFYTILWFFLSTK